MLENYIKNTSFIIVLFRYSISHKDIVVMETVDTFKKQRWNVVKSENNNDIFFPNFYFILQIIYQQIILFS